MSISPNAQYDKMAKSIKARRGKSTNNTTAGSGYTVESLADDKKADLKLKLDGAGITYGKDDKRDVLVSLLVDDK